MSEPTGEHSLDELAKGLATGTLSRGKAIRWMGGALLGAALASVPGVAWANDCRRLGRACRRDSQCCSRNCIRQGDDKVCGCPEGRTPCNDRCVNLDRNENHCGSCFNRCQTGETCADGTCCPNSRVCGTGTSLTCCAEGQECVDGVCQGSCPGTTLTTEGDCNCASICPGGIPITVTCQDNPNCFCFETTEGSGFCVDNFTPTSGCSSSSQCPSGSKCIVNTCIGDSAIGVCATPCPATTSSA
jgi:hypothetical protein